MERILVPVPMRFFFSPEGGHAHANIGQAFKLEEKRAMSSGIQPGVWRHRSLFPARISTQESK